tara:strand:- start:513 stop:746 length:234 start_codon:yes stop_codon:yes gene_type:complete
MCPYAPVSWQSNDKVWQTRFLRQPHLTLEITQILPFLQLMTPKMPFWGLFPTLWRLTQLSSGVDAFFRLYLQRLSAP